MRITASEIVVIGDGRQVDPDHGGIEPLPLLKVSTDEGITGLSELFRVPPGVARSALAGPDSFFGHDIIGAELVHPEAIWNRLYEAMLHSNRRGWALRCLGALDVALWDIHATAAGRPVFELLGGSERNPFQTDPEKTDRARHILPYCTIVSDDWQPETILRQQVERCERLAAAGYRAFKIEPMHSSPETVVELVKRTRAALGPGPMLALDIGYGLNDYPTAISIARQVEPYDLFFFETPFPVDQPDAYARLAANSPIPLAMGEHAATRFEFLDMMDRGGVTVCQPYANNCGGLTEAKRIVDLAKPRGALVCPGNWSTQILGTANAHIAAYSPITPYVEFAPAEIYASPLRRDLQALGLPVADGVMALPSQPGIGIAVPDDLIAKYRLDL